MEKINFDSLCRQKRDLTSHGLSASIILGGMAKYVVAFGTCASFGGAFAEYLAIYWDILMQRYTAQG
ncbi:hypothetical protein SOV_32940 [Sporomusa ovata DSM 2662]|nr:Ni,Fe-hydrogenase I small subunit [Sporomusa ovata DSM 2662]